jgi:asparagine synthase (glutamine-hydrolysing)
MCGIVGVLNIGGRARPVDRTTIVRMRERLAHRGPDGAGAWVAPDGRVGLGHRRLAIIDLSSTGAQPMSDAAEQIWLSFNGEIYNHIELRRELEALGHRFRSSGADSEVIIHAYRQWGTDAVSRLRGMFAFALWDSALRRLWVVRDRLGIKPVYYAQNGGRFAFASEIKALLVDPALPRAIDEDALFHYLSFLTTPAPNTLFRGIRKLAAGTMLLVHEDGRIVEQRYWDALEAAHPVGGSDDEIATALREELREAVRLHQVSDVPIGVFLSGGLDSSTIAALSASEQSGPVRAFTVGYDQDYASYRNEVDQARTVAKYVGADLADIRLTFQDLLEFLPRMVELQDEPIADPVCVPLYFVAKLARDHGISVCQVGEGADELFFGYPNWRRALRLQQLNNAFPSMPWLKRLGLTGLAAMGKGRSLPFDWLARAAEGQPIFWGGAEALPSHWKQAVLSPRLRATFARRSSWEAIAPIYERFRQRAERPSPMRWMSYLDLNLRLPELLLMRVDKMTMAHGLEARVPFLDHKLVEFGMGVPDDVKLRQGQLKAVLKSAARPLLPASIIDRPKQGFGVPIQEWLLQGLPRDLLATVDRFVSDTDCLDQATVQSLFSANAPAGLKWPLLNLSLWWDAYIRKSPEPFVTGESAERVTEQA